MHEYIHVQKDLATVFAQAIQEYHFRKKKFLYMKTILL